VAEELVVPGKAADVEEERPTRVRDVRRVDAAAGEPPGQKRVNGPKGELAVLGARSQARLRVEDVGDLRAGEIGVEGQAGAVIRLCQTIASATGAPVARSQTIVVSRWLVIPSAAIRAGPPTRSTTSRATASWVVQIASGSWVTWPGDGNRCSKGCWALATGRPSRPNAMARDVVVP